MTYLIFHLQDHKIDGTFCLMIFTKTFSCLFSLTKNVDSHMQIYQMRYIKLACSVTRVVSEDFLSYIVNHLDKPLKKLEGLGILC